MSIDHPFEVLATWGKLNGKPGDFRVKNFQDRMTAYPAEVWIVDHDTVRNPYGPVVSSQ